MKPASLDVRADESRGFWVAWVGMCVALVACRGAAFRIRGEAAPPRLDANYDESRVGAYTLPPPLVTQAGDAVRSKEEWLERRRPELVRLFEDNIYGRSPPAPRETWAAVRSVTAAALGGSATRKEIEVHLARDPSQASFDLLLYLPKDAVGPVPVFLALNSWGNHSIERDPTVRLSTQWMRSDASKGIVGNRATQASRGSDAARWPLRSIVERGYGLATVYYGDLDPDYHDGFRNGVHALDRRARTKQSWASIAAWAWGLSRALDQLQREPGVNARKVVVLGHSRLGKAALWAAAQDTRFAMAISNDSGEGGAALARRNFGQTALDLAERFPHWFCERYRSLAADPTDLPVDQHLLLALVAPRPLYIASASDDHWADPKGEFLAAVAADPVYRLFDEPGLGPAKWPQPGEAVGVSVRYHLRPGAHDLTPYDWERFMEFADPYLK